MYPGSRINLPSTSNMHTFTNPGSATNFNGTATTISYSTGSFSRSDWNDWMGGRTVGTEHIAVPPQILGSSVFHGSDDERFFGRSLRNDIIYGSAGSYIDGDRRACKRKNNDERILGYSGTPYSDWDGDGGRGRDISSRRLLDSYSCMPEMCNGSNFSTSASSSRIRDPEEPVMMARHGSAFGSAISEDYGSNPAMRGPGPQRSVRSRLHPVPLYNESNLRPVARHFQGRSSHFLVQQPLDAEASPVFQRRGIPPAELTTTRFCGGFTLSPSVSTIGVRGGGSVQSLYLSPLENRMSSEVRQSQLQPQPQPQPQHQPQPQPQPQVQMMHNPTMLLNNTHWHHPQNVQIQSAGVQQQASGHINHFSSAAAAAPPGHFNHFTRAMATVPMDMFVSSAGGGGGLQQPINPRSFEQNGRPLPRSALEISLDRLQLLRNEDGGRNRSSSEEMFLFDRSAIYSAFDTYDRHQDMRLDVDNMTYEELLALEEQIGNVSTGLNDESILKCLEIKTLSVFTTEIGSTNEEPQNCSVCQEEYEGTDTIGTLQCGHNYHAECIKKWLIQKNECPICKAPALKKD